MDDDEEVTIEVTHDNHAYTIIDAADFLGEHVDAMYDLMGGEITRESIIGKVMHRLLDGAAS
jgi:hypothetical protein